MSMRIIRLAFRLARFLSMLFHLMTPSLCLLPADVNVLRLKLSHELLEPYNACRIIPLDKNPGVGPNGIGRAITKCLKTKFMVLGLSYQLRHGQKCGIEYAIHTLRKQYENTDSDAKLLIDAENAFNSLNRNLASKNIANIRSSILPAIENS